MPRKKKIKLPLDAIIAGLHEYVQASCYDCITPELFVYYVLEEWMIIDDIFSYNDVMHEFEVIISETMERLPEPLELGELELSYELGQCFLRARESMEKLGTKEVTVTQLMC